MRRSAGVLVLLTVAAGLAFAQGGSDKAAARPSATVAKSVVADKDAIVAGDKESIAALFREYSRCVMSNDLAGYLALHEGDAYKMPPDAPMYQIGAAAQSLKVAWDKRAAGYTTEMRIDPKEIVVFGDHAYSMGTYYVAGTPKAGGDPIVTDGKFLTLFDKGSDGKWRIRRDCYNSNVPPKK
jgi:ketosteroid isomerase-like protein